jgi:hypothetical protein
MSKKILYKISRFFWITIFCFSFRVAQAANYDLQIPLPGVSGTVSGPSQYIQAIFTYGLSIVGITALLALVIGGFRYLTSGENETRKTSGKEWIWGAVIGLVLMLCSWLILNTINPKLTSLSEPQLMTITLEPHRGLSYNEGTKTYDVKNWNDVKSLASYSNNDIIAAVKAAAAAYPNVPEDMIWAVIAQESGKYGAGAISSKGAQGLMQLMPGTASMLGVTDPFDIGQNVMAGTKYLSMNYQQFGNWTDALGGYNAGPGRVTQYGGGANIPFEETQNYIANIRGIVPQYF